MLENPSESSSSSPAANVATIKRYAPPNQRNRSLGRRKSGGDRLERANSYANEGEKTHAAASRNAPALEHGDAGGSNRVNESSHLALIPLVGCCNSEASQLLNNRWAAAINAYNNPSIDLAERPVFYSGSGGTAWGQFRLPHQMMTPTVGGGPSSGFQRDFLSDLWIAMRNARASSDI